MNNLMKPEKAEVPIPEFKDIVTQFDEAFDFIDNIVLKNYIAKLNELEIVQLDETVKQTNIAENVRFFKINEMVYQQEEYSTYKFASVFNSVSNLECGIFIIIDSNGERTDFYLGIKSLSKNRTTSSLQDTLKNALTGQFPGIKVKNYLEEEMKHVLDNIKGNSIAAVTCVASNRTVEKLENDSFIQGIEKLVLAMQGQKYTGIIVANPVKQEELVATRKAYEDIYTQLSPFANTQVSYASNSAYSLSNALSRGSSRGSSYTTNTSETKGESKSTSASSSDSVTEQSLGTKLAMGSATAISIAGAALAPFTGGVSLAVGGVVAGGIGLIGSAINKSETQGSTTSESETTNNSSTNGESSGTNESTNQNTTDSKGITEGKSQNLQVTMQNKSIINTLERIDLQFKRLQECESLGMWECAAYFLSDNQYAAEIAGSTYKALMRGENSGIEVSAVNTWNKLNGTKTEMIVDYVKNFIHPTFVYPTSGEDIYVTPCALISGNELAVQMGLPRKSVCGLPVIDHVEFAQEVVKYSNEIENHNINLGKIFNMGAVTKTGVKLNRPSLAMHTFITGSTGSGKSNTVYEMLDQLDTVDIKFLVIEPTKGEYKNVFGNRKNVSVFGTNPKCTELIKINPFKFPSEIHLLEHVDRLIEIFNVCWPMYAAMPAILKESVLQSYEKSGWDLVTSKNKYSDDLFPTFQDLQEELINVIENSAYSQELKSNYIGSLVTRVNSLTNGLNGQIFAADEVDNALLFDRNAIVDLSRVGSLETKSLIMGILIVRLNEYRMSNSNGMNIPLKHVTVLEEAHNILKRTSTDQNSESPNLVGKSVELLSNAIAEMRTYGEGFIIADQSPSAVDYSAIRNTNTKIIMRLPDEEDRRTAGKSAALKDEQLDEIAKLPTGVAVVYQNDWLEPILCQVSKFDGDNQAYTYESQKIPNVDVNAAFNTELIKLLLVKRVDELLEIDIDKLDRLIDYARISTKNKIGIYSLINEYRYSKKLNIWDIEEFENLAELISELLDSKTKVENSISNSFNYSELTVKLKDIINQKTDGLSDEVMLATCHCLMKEVAKSGEHKFEIYAAWRNLAETGGF